MLIVEQMFEVVSRGLGVATRGPQPGGDTGETKWHTRADLPKTAANQLKIILFFTHPSDDLPPNQPHLTGPSEGGDLMEVCTVGADAVPDGHADRAFVLVRRVGVVVGVLFGLGLLAVLMADHASAEQSATRQVDDTGGLGRLTESLTEPVADAVVTPIVDAAVTPLAATVVEPLAPVVRAVVEPLAPVVRPVVEAVAPVTEPLLRPVAAAQPVLDPVVATVAPVTKPVVAAVASATAPVEVSALVVVPGNGSSSAPVVRFAEPVSVYSGQSTAPFSPAPRQDVPGPPVHYAVTGGGAVGGSGGAHGADVLPSVLDGVRSEQDTQVRAPPGTVVGAAWFAYDDRDHPS
jgi:hypothetical protein